MLILTIRTDKPEAEIGLYNDKSCLSYETWPAHRQLAETLHSKIEELLKAQSKTWEDIDAIVCFQGPGSFTGLRIGLSVGNAISYGLSLPIVAGGGERWIEHGIERLMKKENDEIAIPEYGSEPHITQPRK
jgi:tRNA threonylcarbamoyladenosine biosynthesis protein TsaB